MKKLTLNLGIRVEGRSKSDTGRNKNEEMREEKGKALKKDMDNPSFL